jgi:hypothetical protein
MTSGHRQSLIGAETETVAMPIQIFRNHEPMGCTFGSCGNHGDWDVRLPDGREGRACHGHLKVLAAQYGGTTDWVTEDLDNFWWLVFAGVLAFVAVGLSSYYIGYTLDNVVATIVGWAWFLGNLFGVWRLYKWADGRLSGKARILVGIPIFVAWLFLQLVPVLLIMQFT